MFLLCFMWYGFLLFMFLVLLKVFVSKKSTFRCGTMVEVKVDDDVDVWIPSVIVKEMVNRKSFVVKSLKNLSWNDGEESKPNRTVGSSSIRLTPPTVTDGVC